MARKARVFATLHVPGIHNWPDCDIKDVEFLQYPHRHMFTIRVIVNVTHENRDVEFLMLKDRIFIALDELYPRDQLGQYLFEHRSCEMISDDLYGILKNEFDVHEIMVDEDGENGSIIVYDAP